MSQRSVSRAEFDQLVSEFAVLRLQVQELQSQLDSAAAPSEAGSFSVVTSQSSTGAALGADLPELRVQAAEQIGRWIRRALDQQHRGLSGREKVDLASRLYVVAKDIKGTVFDPPRVFDTWSEARALVTVGKQYGDSVFVGFPSKAEARIALGVAGLQIPAALSRHQ